MTRNLKTLGLALVATFLLGALATSSASAQFITSDGPVTLKGTETGGFGKGGNALTAFGGKTECKDARFFGHKYKTAEPLEATSTLATITASPTVIGPCTTTLEESGTSFSSTVDMNGCDFVLHPGSTTETGGVKGYGVVFTVECQNSNEHIQVTVFSSASHAIKICTVTVTVPAEGVEGPHITNLPKSIDTPTDFLGIQGTFTGMTVHKSGLCGTEQEKAAALDIDYRFKGYNNTGESTGVTITD